MIHMVFNNIYKDYLLHINDIACCLMNCSQLFYVNFYLVKEYFHIFFLNNHGSILLNLSKITVTN